MKHLSWPAVLLVLICTRTDVQAQWFYAPPLGVGEILVGRSFGFSRHGRHLSFSAYVSKAYGLGYYAPYPGFSPYGVTVVYGSPPPVVSAAPIVIVQAPRDDRDDEDLPQVGWGRRARRPADLEDDEKWLVIRPRPRQEEDRKSPVIRRRPLQEDDYRAGPEAPEMREEPPLRGDRASVFRPIQPADRARAREAMPTEKPTLPLPDHGPAPAARQPPASRPLAPELPSEEPARHVALAKESFAAEEYGRAERRLRQATRAQPDEPLPHFLLAQALFARGKYQEAVASIHAGMSLQPDWPEADFRPATLYQANAPDFADQVKRLRETLHQHPNDPVLLFLLGYQLWFDGQYEEARAFFRRAAAVAPDKTFIDRFLQAKPKAPIAKK